MVADNVNDDDDTMAKAEGDDEASVLYSAMALANELSARLDKIDDRLRAITGGDVVSKSVVV